MFAKVFVVTFISNHILEECSQAAFCVASKFLIFVIKEKSLKDFIRFHKILHFDECSPVGLCYCERRVHLMGTAWNISNFILSLV
jgi:hypothetical protein